MPIYLLMFPLKTRNKKLKLFKNLLLAFVSHIYPLYNNEYKLRVCDYSKQLYFIKLFFNLKIKAWNQIFLFFLENSHN